MPLIDTYGTSEGKTKCHWHGPNTLAGARDSNKTQGRPDETGCPESQNGKETWREWSSWVTQNPRSEAPLDTGASDKSREWGQFRGPDGALVKGKQSSKLSLDSAGGWKAASSTDLYILS